jgi:pimeloyl-ACP methyl ester carboxylesterase
MPSAPRPAAAASTAVLLVHGLWTGRWIWTWFARALRRQGWRTRAGAYASMRAGLQENAACLLAQAEAVDAGTLHFVGHSLGGLLLLAALAERPAAPPGRIVLLGSPVAGCHAGQRLARLPGGETLLGSSLRDWLAAPLARWTGPRELGIIAGNLGVGLGRLVAPDLHVPNDGVVSVAETRLPGARDHLVLPVAHSAMPLSGATLAQVQHFLRHGRFDRPP